MTKSTFTFSILLLASAALAQSESAATSAGSPRTVYTPGYFLDEVKFDGDAHRYYHDYALEKSYGVVPSISPYDEAGASILDWSGYNSRTYTVKDAGRYVASWNFYTHNSQLYQKASVTGYPKSYAVTYSFLAGLPNKPENLDVIPLLKMMSYDLDYEANGGTWNEQPQGLDNVCWSNTIAVASSKVVGRTGYAFVDWNTLSNGKGTPVAQGQTCTGGVAFAIDSATVDGNGHTNITLYAQWQANLYTLQLQPGVGVDKIYYKTSASAAWQSTTVTQDVSVAFNETWSAYAVPKEGYAYTATSKEKPQTGTMGTGGASFAPAATANKYKLRLVPGTGIATIYYKVHGATVWTSISHETEIDVTYDTKWFACAEAETGYDYSEYTKDSPLGGTMGVDGATFNPVAALKSYNLTLTPGTGIARIFYQIGATADPSQWTETASSTTVPVDFKATWWAYAEARPGYTYTATSTNNPTSGTIGTSGGKFEPKATPNTISVVFDGNGKTSGTMSTQSFTYDEPQALRENAYSRAYTVSFDPQGGENVADRAAEYPFLNWNDRADGQGAYVYGNTATVTNPCDAVEGIVRLYAQWDTHNQGATLPGAKWDDGHKFAGWYSKSDCQAEDYVGKKDDLYTPTNNVTLYAKWTVNTYTVTFYDDDPKKGGNVITNVLVAWHGTAEEPTPPTKAYYKFSQWTGTGDWTSVESDLDVWAQWNAKNYSVRYHSNYANGQQKEISDTVGLSCNIDTYPQSIPVVSVTYLGYEKVGYVSNQDGWNTDPKSSQVKYTPSSNPTTWGLDWVRYNKLDPDGFGSEEVDFYAIWSPNAYTVRFNKGAEAATGSMPDQAFTYDQAQALTANGFSYVGQDFLGWATSSGDAAARRVAYADKEVVSNLTATANDTVNLYAVWSNYHYVRFDKSGATNETEMALQTFSGAETNALYANVYGKVGYTFAGWATNTGDAAACRVSYTNCQDVSFPSAQPGETNILYATWTTNTYTIVFDPGTNGVLGTMADLTNCAYDTAISVPCAYTNYMSYAFLGWARAPGGEVEIPASRLVVSNLTAEANGTVKLYAVWDGLGELSEAAGLTNAVLRATLGGDKYIWRRVIGGSGEAGDEGHDDRVACARKNELYSGSEAGKWVLSMMVNGPGTLQFKWYYRRKNSTVTSYAIRNADAVVTNLPSASNHTDWNDAVRLDLSGEGWHEITWSLDGTLKPNGESYPVIAIDDVIWTPGVEVDPSDPPTYETKAEAEAAAAQARVVRPNAEVEGVISAEGYNALFDVKVVQTAFVPPAASEAWSLVPALKESVSNEVQTALDAAGANLCSVVTNDPVSVSFEMKAGLYYGLAGAAILANLPATDPETWVLGSNKTQAVTAPRPSETAAFYELRMSPCPAEKANPSDGE